MTLIRAELSREEIAALVCDTLEQAGVSVVLSGGAVVSIYSDNEFESLDLDFIGIGLARKIGDAMTGLGFEKSGRHWSHPDTRFWVEFPPGPVQVGDAIVTEFAERQTSVGKRHPIDLERVRRWSIRESSSSKFERFVARLNAANVR